MRVLERHKRGVLAIAWCPQDSDLLLSAAKDNQVFCWNPNSEVPGGDVSDPCDWQVMSCDLSCDHSGGVRVTGHFAVDV